MKFESTTALRHSPKQVRGQRKVDHILRVAEALFAEVGYENATTNAVAARAGVSIGSLYQFFADKEAVVEALADRYIQQTRVAIGKEFATEEDKDLEPFLGGVMALLVKQQEQRPYFLQCLATTRPSRALSDKMDMVIEEYAILLTKWLSTRAGVDEADKMLRLQAQVCVRIVTGLLPMALHAKGRERTRVMAQIVSVLVRYLAPVVESHGVS